MEEERVSTKPKIFNSEIKKTPPHTFYIYAGIYSAFMAGKEAALFSFERT